jgi:hypothetical protein
MVKRDAIADSCDRESGMPHHIPNYHNVSQTNSAILADHKIVEAPEDFDAEKVDEVSIDEALGLV